MLSGLGASVGVLVVLRLSTGGVSSRLLVSLAVVSLALLVVDRVVGRRRVEKRGEPAEDGRADADLDA